MVIVLTAILILLVHFGLLFYASKHYNRPFWRGYLDGMALPALFVFRLLPINWQERLWSWLPDNCEMPGCSRKGVLGNENRIDGKIVCDYCNARMMREREGNN